MRICVHRSKGLTVAIVVAACGLSVWYAPSAGAAPEPITFVISHHFGHEVDETTGGDVCTVSSGDICQAGKQSASAGGFIYPESVAVGPTGEVYVTDKVNNRVAIFDSEGHFRSVFGWEVNKKGGDECTAAEESECQAGEAWTGERSGQTVPTGLPGQIYRSQDVAIDENSGDVYVLEAGYHRVEQFTKTGEFVLMIGGDVNKTRDAILGATDAEKDLCTAASHDECGPGTASVDGSTVHGAFKPREGAGTLLAVGGPDDLLYVADEGRIQEFDASSGEWFGEISLAGLSSSSLPNAIAVDAGGDVFVADPGSVAQPGVPGVHKYNPSGILQSSVIDGASTGVRALAVDPKGRLGVIDSEQLRFFGVMYNIETGEPVSEFAPPSGEMRGDPAGLAFSAADGLYVPETTAQEVDGYVLGLFPAVRTCSPEDITATSVKLCGEVNPNGLLTSAGFEYTPPRGSVTPTTFEGAGEAFQKFSLDVTGLVPNQTYSYNTVAKAEYEAQREVARAAKVEFQTALLPPEIVGTPQVSYVKAHSVVLGDALNPEHDVTSYEFVYGQCPTLAKCASAESTVVGQSAQYGAVNVIEEARSLEPETTYHYQLVATNHAGERKGVEATFTTAKPPAIEVAVSSAGSITPTTATLSGEINANGEAATYGFEIAPYTGGEIAYYMVYQGSVGGARTAVETTVTELAPDSPYVFRLSAKRGVSDVQSAPTVFTTGAWPALEEVQIAAKLPVPRISFPKVKAAKRHCRRGTHRDSRGKCVVNRKKSKRSRTGKVRKSSARR